jgi:hypothetical protein
MKKIFLIFCGVIIVFFIAGMFMFIRSGSHQAKNITIPNIKNMTYVVSGETFTLKDGKAEKEYVPGSASKNTLTMFGEPVYGDLNGDGKNDAAILLTNDTGGSGTFYYAVLAINNGTSYRATNAMLLGDRIAPQTVEIHDGRTVYNFAERKAGEPMTTQPSVGKSVWINYDKNTGEIGEWVKDFEGESANELTEAAARAIAEKSCIKIEETLGSGSHNRITQTWWFDANLKSTNKGCNPACVVSELTKTAEINWRCTGLLPAN